MISNFLNLAVVVVSEAGDSGAFPDATASKLKREKEKGERGGGDALTVLTNGK